ncbi:hypothetical protein CsSME_00034106 [Camellia sinensis var. sinensis]
MKLSQIIKVGPMITSQSVPGQNIVLVRPRTLGQTNPKVTPSSMKNVQLNGQEQEVTTIVILVDKWLRLFLLLWLEG